MPDLSDFFLIATPIGLLSGALLRRWMTKYRHPDRHAESKQAHQNFMASMKTKRPKTRHSAQPRYRHH